jgi:hypothetical protein
VVDPNTSTEVLFELGKKYPELLIQNPIFPLWLLEDPTLSRLPLETLVEVAKQPELPSGVLTLLSTHEDEFFEVVESVASNLNTPLEILLLWVEEAHSNTSDTALRNLTVPRELVAPLERVQVRVRSLWRSREKPGSPEEPALSKNEIAYLLTRGPNSRCWLARCPEISLDIMDELLSYQEEPVADSLASNPNTPAHLLIEIAQEYVEDYPICNQMLGWRRDLPSLVYGVWAQSTLRSVRSELAEIPTTPPELLESLSKDPDDFVRKCVAKRSELPASIFWILASDSDVEVRCAVATNKEAPDEVLALLRNDPDAQVRACFA